MFELIDRFKAEAEDRVRDIERLLGELKRADDPAEPADAIRDHAHKLKGAAGVLGFPEMKERAAELEEVAASQTAAADGATAAGAIKPAADALEGTLPA
ncbi:MAG: Hpt domain-containing protein [Solirubrobacterales bacterium]